jgi:hypothetical protein
MENTLFVPNLAPLPTGDKRIKAIERLATEKSRALRLIRLNPPLESGKD